ncbi:MAG: ATP-binding protein [Verrucomicrobia bacterium]|nr:ATP-binding protein [Verrucomicrobiota bacterium]
MKAPRKITFLGEPSRLAEIRDCAREFLAGVGFNEEDEARIVMALDEACTNIIRHAHEGFIKPVRLEMKWLKDRLRFVLRDYGRTFVPLTIPSQDIQVTKPGGLGVFIIREVFDLVEYTPQVRGTRLTLEKRLPASRTQSSL